MKKCRQNALTGPKTPIFRPFLPFSEQNCVEQSGPGYDPQAAVMRWLPLATIAILTPGGSILTRDVRHKYGEIICIQ